MKRVAAGAHLPTPWLFEPAKRPDRADYCLGQLLLAYWEKKHYRFFVNIPPICELVWFIH